MNAAPEIGFGSSASRAEGAPAGRATGPDAQSGLRPAADDPDWREFAPPDAEAAGVSAIGKNYAAEAAIKAGDWRFRKFLASAHGLEPPLTAERATQRLRGLLGVTSRKELNVSGSIAAARWVRLRDEFEAWRREQ